MPYVSRVGDIPGECCTLVTAVAGGRVAALTEEHNPR